MIKAFWPSNGIHEVLYLVHLNFHTLWQEELISQKKNKDWNSITMAKFRSIWAEWAPIGIRKIGSKALGIESEESGEAVQCPAGGVSVKAICKALGRGRVQSRNQVWISPLKSTSYTGSGNQELLQQAGKQKLKLPLEKLRRHWPKLSWQNMIGEKLLN